MDQRSPADRANQLMVDSLIADGALWSPALIAAFRATPRHLFLDRVYQYVSKQNRWREVITRDPGREELRLLYSDRALITHLGRDPRSDRQVPISSSSQPSLMAQMLEDLHLQPGLRVLEIGAGTGYNAALIAHLVGPGRVTSIDVDRNVLAEAWDHLRRFPDRQVTLKHADGRLGFPESAPFDRVMVTAATPRIESLWLDQLADGGLLSAPLTFAPGLSFIIVGTVGPASATFPQWRDEPEAVPSMVPATSLRTFTGRLVRAAYFMPLRSENDTGDPDDESAEGIDGLQPVLAPWSDVFHRRRSRTAWLKLVQSLAFYAWLRGMTIGCRTQQDGQPMYGISDGTHRCWYGPGQWLATDRDGQHLGWNVWRAWLDAGGPWPVEFQLQIMDDRQPPSTTRHEQYIRVIDRVRHVWTLIEVRDRGTWI